MAEQLLDVDGAELYVEVDGRRAAGRARPRPRPLGRALEPRLRRARRRHTLVRVDLRGAGRSRELERDGALARALGRRSRRRARRGSSSSGRRSSGTRSAPPSRSSSRSSGPSCAGALVLIGGEADLSNLAPRMLASAERIESMGLEALGRRVLVEEPAVLGAVARARPVDPRRVPRPAARERSGRLRAPVPRDRRRGAALRPPRRGRPARARRRRRARRPHAARARARARARAPERAARRAAGRRPLDPARGAARRRRRRSRAFLAERRGGRRRATAARGVLRADTTPRNSREGPFGHLDVRWVVGAAHRRVADRVRPVDLPVRGDAREPPPPERRRGGDGRQRPRHAEVGDRRLDLGPGDICFIPRRTPHRITGTSEDEDCVILWAFGGAATIEQAGYVPLPDDEEKVQ